MPTLAGGGVMPTLAGGGVISHSTLGRQQYQQYYLSTTHGSILYNSIIYRNKAISITTRRSKALAP